MSLLKEATSLFEGNLGYTLSDYQRLVELRDKARGDEAAQIGRLIETFISQAPAQTVMRIMNLG